MRITIQSDLGTILGIVHVSDKDLDDCTAMMDLESRMLDARTGYRDWLTAMESVGLEPVNRWGGPVLVPTELRNNETD